MVGNFDHSKEREGEMNLILIRAPNSDGTPGILIVNDTRFCYTLEDRVRVDGKVPGDTAIPVGRYPVNLDYSKRFRRLMPHIRNVYDFDAIEMHGGNTTADTAGCILVAYNKISLNTIQGSAVDALIELLKSSEQHWIEIFNRFPYRYDL
jgi:hypothetical protein